MAESRTLEFPMPGHRTLEFQMVAGPMLGRLRSTSSTCALRAGFGGFPAKITMPVAR
jgi:hypothetical protein